MKIVIAVDNFDPNKGYLEYYLARELTELGHKVCVLTFGWSKRVFRITLKEGFEVISIPHAAVVNEYHIPSFNGVAFIVKFIRIEKPDVIHCHPLYSPLSLIFLMWKNTFRYKIVGNVLTQMNEVFTSWNIKKRLLIYGSKIVVKHYAEKRSDMLFAKSKELMKSILRSYNLHPYKFRIIPLGADPELFKFDSKTRVTLRKRLGISKSDVVVVYSGKIDPSKRLDALIRTLSQIMARNSKVKLLIVGKGSLSYLEYLNKFILSLKISNKVIFCPWVNRTLLPSFYSASDIGVWPGLSSVSIVEAASVGLPVIIVRYPVEIYAIQNGNGFAFEIGNYNELHKYLDILIRDGKLRKEMGHKSRLLVEQKLNWKTIAIQYLNAYKLAYDWRGVLK